ncbi:MAG TPA: caspase family protein, partial [Kofleriaceae bacterium]
MTLYRDAYAPTERVAGGVVEGRRRIAVIGIDQYEQPWGKLQNAVNDARGVLAIFKELGFEPACDPLLDGAATRDALNRLVKDQLRVSAREGDSLIVFFAGHGHTDKTSVAKRGYLIPIDADPPDGSRDTWIRLDDWLGSLAELDHQHVLAILDSCRSGIVL